MFILLVILMAGVIHIGMVNEQLTEENDKLKRAVYGHEERND